MGIAIALIVIVVGSVLFQLLSPWWLTPIASNWKQMDHTLTITVVICGLFFVAINLFVIVLAFTLLQFGVARHWVYYESSSRDVT